MVPPQESLQSRIRTHVIYIVAGNFCFLLVLGLLWANYILLSIYFEPIAWALLCAIALFPTKTAIVKFLLRAGGSTLSEDGKLDEFEPDKHFFSSLALVRLRQPCLQCRTFAHRPPFNLLLCL